MRRDDQDEPKEPVAFVFHFQIANGSGRKACRVRINAPNYHNANDLFRQNFVSFDTGVLAFECVFNSLMSEAVYSLRTIVFFVDFLATSISNLIQCGLISRSHLPSSEQMRTHSHLLLIHSRHPIGAL